MLLQGAREMLRELENVEARPDGDRYRLFGVKFFCSACHADYAIVTAKVTGSEDVSTFLVPAWLPGDRDAGVATPPGPITFHIPLEAPFTGRA